VNSLEIESAQNKTYPAFVQNDLVSAAQSDYIAMRSLYVLVGGGSLWKKIAHNGAECLEKVMKAFLVSKGLTTPKRSGHNLELLRQDCEKKDTFFTDSELIKFCTNYSAGKGNEVLRYGFQQNTGAYGANLEKIIELVDKFFLGSLVRIDPSGFVASNTDIAALLCKTMFTDSVSNVHSPTQIQNLQIVLKHNNQFLDDFIKHVNEFVKKLHKN